MIITQDYIAEMVKRLRNWDISDSDKEVIADMLEQLAAERDALDEACITWSEVSQRNYQRAKAAEAREKALLDSNQVQRDATIENVALRAQLKAAEAEVKALIEAGNRMADSIKSNYYDPGAATAWDVTLQEKPND